ncbi:MAG: VWA domain-containing protein [Gammaproteobacteria bacterium]|nr:VWA domain-containing protein [Gammaproteobacteria bacterium]
MQQTLENFLKALRGLDVRVSLDESIEAHRTVDLVGFENKEILRHALGVTLAKSEHEKLTFEECFEHFFAINDFSGDDSSEDDQEADPESRQPPTPGEDASEGGTPTTDELAQMLLNNDRAALAAAMAAAANEAEISNIRLFTQRGVFMRRILESMGLRDLERLIQQFRQGTPEEQRTAEALEAGRERLMEEARNLVERHIALYADPASERLREDFLANARLTNIPQRDMLRVRRIVKKMAKRLATRHARRRLNARSGRLDVRRTIRRNVAHDGVPFNLEWRYTRIERPRIIAICDVSGSVAAAAQFLLLFLYSLNEVLSGLRAFAFSSHLVEVSDILANEDWDEAVPKILQEIGFRSTDYGQTLVDLKTDYLDLIDRHTTVVILGDARNNQGNPQTEIMQLVYERAKRVVWLNPEPKAFWGTGDSEMHRYAPYCNLVRICNTVKHLERVVDDMLTFGSRG